MTTLRAWLDEHADALRVLEQTRDIMEHRRPLPEVEARIREHLAGARSADLFARTPDQLEADVAARVASYAATHPGALE